MEENKILETVVSTNVRKMKKYESKIRKMAKGESLSKDCSKPSHHSRLSSSNIKMYVWKSNAIEEINDGFLGGGDGKDPP